MSKGPVAAPDYFRLVPADAAPRPAQRVRGAGHHRVAYLRRRRRRLLRVRAGPAPRCLHSYLRQPFYKALAVLRVLYRLYRCPQHFHAVLVQNACALKFYPAVQRGLPAEREQDAVRSLLLYHLRNKDGCYRQEVCRVRHPFARLNCRYVGVQQHGIYAFLPQRLERLRPGIVEFPRLSYL